MKRASVALLLALGLLGHSLPANAEINRSASDRAFDAMQAQDRRDRAEAEGDELAFHVELQEELNAIMRAAPGPRSKEALKKAGIAYINYQIAMCDAVETFYAEAGGMGGKGASDHCKAMLRQDFMNALYRFFPR